MAGKPVAMSINYLKILGVILTSIFLQAFARFKAGPEEPLDALNDSAPFLPLVLPTGEILLVQKSRIAVVSTALPEIDELAEPGTVGMHVEMVLSTGEAHIGSVGWHQPLFHVLRIRRIGHLLELDRVLESHFLQCRVPA